MKTKTLATLAVVALVAVIAAALALRSGSAPTASPASGAPAASPFADVGAKVNEVASLTVKTAKAESTVELVDGTWRLKDKSGYPVDAGKVREVILSLAALKNFEPKTTRPEGFKTLGVDDVVKGAETPSGTPPGDAPDAPRSLLLTLNDKAGQPVTSVIVGNIKYPNSAGISGSAGPQGIYVRKPSEQQSYLAEGKLDVPREPLNWLATEFADIARDRVRSVTLTPRENPEADRIAVVRDKPGEGAFVVQNIPAGKQLKDGSMSESLAAGLVKTTFEDVAKVETIDFAAAPGPVVEIRTWDGLIVKVETTKVGERWWWKLTPSADPDPYKEAPAPPPAPAPAADGTPAPTPPPAAPAEPKPKRTPEEVKKEVDELAARWSGWAYSPFSYKATAFTKKLSVELKDPTPPTPPAGTPPAPAPTEFPGAAPAVPPQP